jgi:hypothetical protein
MKRIAIEWRHLDVDGATCERCGDTGAELRRAVDALNAECNARGVGVTLEEVHLGADEVAGSNRILIDGRPLESLLPEGRSGTSACTSCDTLVEGSGTQCLTVEVGAARYEAVPAALVREAVCRVADCCRSGCGCG